MSAVATYPETVETNIYWNLLSGANKTVKVQLLRKLKQDLTTQLDETDVRDEIGQAAYYELIKKFNTYKSYAAGWDGEDAVPLTKKVVENFNLVLEQLDYKLLQGLTIYPETNGSLLIDSTKREAGISLGEQNFSYYEIINDKITGKNSIPFSVKAISEVISQINR